MYKEKDETIAYMKVWDTFSIGIIYQFRKYYVARFEEYKNGLMVFPIRDYKTIGGAERFLMNKLPDDCKEIKRAPESVVRAGLYWKKQ